MSVDKLRGIVEEIMAITEIIVGRKNWLANQMIVPDDTSHIKSGYGVADRGKNKAGRGTPESQN